MPSCLPSNDSPTREIDEQARLKMVFGDGRHAVQGDRQKYDMIISEPSNPWLAGVSNLFTQEFFEAARSTSSPGACSRNGCRLTISR